MVYSEESIESNEEYIRENLRDLVLTLLQSRSLCGYDLIKLIYQRFEVTVSKGRVYPLLYSLRDRGILEVSEENKKGKRVKIYSLTEKGEELMEERAQKISAVRRKLGLRES